MNITSIKNVQYSIPRRNFANKNTSQPNFKGYTHEVTICYPSHYEHFEPRYNMIENLKETGTKLSYKDLNEREYDMYNRINQIPPRIYIASPNEEIPGKIYKTHTHIQRNDLYLSQIKKDYRYGYKNFARNAYLEAQHYKELQKNREEITGKNTKKIEALTKNYEIVAKENLPQKVKERLEHDRNEKVLQLKQEMEIAQKQAQRADKNLDKAQKRFEVLKKMDELGGQYNQLMADIAKVSSLPYNRPSHSFYHRNDALKNVEKIEPVYNKKAEQLKRLELDKDMKNKEAAVQKAKNELNELKQQLEAAKAELKHWQDFMAEEDKQREKLQTVDEPALVEKMNKAYEDIAVFYKKYYPEWADI